MNPYRSLVLFSMIFPCIGLPSFGVRALEMKAQAQASKSENSSQHVLQFFEEDPFLWLEEIESTRSVEFVEQLNAKSKATLESDPRFETINSSLKAVLSATDRIPAITIEGEFVFSIWQDSTNVRGVWRRARVSEFNASAANPQWEVLLDIDKLSTDENEQWVMKGATCLAPLSDLCLVSLSRGGKDAVVIREYSLATKSFVSPLNEDGFFIPESKSSAQWVDANTLAVAADLGPGSVTTAGYPKSLRIWKRGTLLASTQPLSTVPDNHVSAAFEVYDSPEGQTIVASDSIDFFSQHYSSYDPDTGRLTPLPFPEGSELKTVYMNRGIVSTRQDLTIQGRVLAAGSLLAYSEENFDSPEVLFEPNETTVLSGVLRTQDALILVLLQNVSSKLLALNFDSGTWTRTEIPTPDFAFTTVAASSSAARGFYLSTQSFLTPPQLLFAAPKPDATASGAAFEFMVIRSLKAQFDAQNLEATQFFSTSKDGTKVPAFLIHKKGLVPNGDHPTLLYGYGGFEISLTPSYLSRLGKSWLEKGGVYVVANIRGGGEFGPKWHQAALKENRQRAFDDFIAVAENLVAQKITSPRRLGIRGGSNGGLLVAAVMVQRPDLFNAVVCDVPLIDMLRFNKLLAGASWEGEYGNPDETNSPAALALQKYSPYQNVKATASMPQVLFTTSTRDDRVHPGHARKMAARMLEQGHKVLFYENREGGHGGASTIEQQAQMDALRYTFLHQQLMD